MVCILLFTVNSLGLWLHTLFLSLSLTLSFLPHPYINKSQYYSNGETHEGIGEE